MLQNFLRLPPAPVGDLGQAAALWQQPLPREKSSAGVLLLKPFAGEMLAFFFGGGPGVAGPTEPYLTPIFSEWRFACGSAVRESTGKSH